jgi:predicted Fe-Mo cluster-binding NifX family protein
LRVAVPSEGPDLGSKVSDRLGLSPYLLIVDPESKDFEVLRSPRDSGSGAGMQMVALIIAKKCDVLLAKWCSPTAEKVLTAHGVEMVTGVSGSVTEALEEFEREGLEGRVGKREDLRLNRWKIDCTAAALAIRSAANQIRGLLPVMVGVILLAGLFMAFLADGFVTTLFTGSLGWDSFWGASLGSLFAGNPINSYIIGGQLLELGISLVAVTAFLCSWVTVGLVQLPAESAALGWKFAVVRNLSCFGLCVVVSFAMTFILGLFGM